jgi:hypothetical protein
MAELVESFGWKGKATTEIVDEGNIIILRCWKKHKETGEQYFTEHKVTKQSVDVLQGIMAKNCTPRTEYKCYYFWKKLIEHYKLNDLEFMGVDREALKKMMYDRHGFIAPAVVDGVLDEIAPLIIYEAFDGKKERALWYFPLWYFPLLVLRARGIVADTEKVIIYLGD